MKDQALGAIAVGCLGLGAVGAAWTLHALSSTDYYCPGPSTSMVVPLLAPCQGFNTAVAHTAAGDDVVRISLRTLGSEPEPARPPRTLFAEK
ncbi:MAG: hypothetical protein ABW213_08355 [Tardiphaga sp.]